jgi:hypothetical protein
MSIDDTERQAGSRTGSNDRLRHAIDTGDSNDKVAASDPSQAPLSTDDEASEGHDEDGLRVARQANKAPGSQ